MKKCYTCIHYSAFIFTLAFLLVDVNAIAQVSVNASSGSGQVSVSGSSFSPIYVSVQQPGNMPASTGSYSKTTDQFENGTVTLSSSGPITYQVTPAALAIGTHQTKTWTGKIMGDPTNIPPAGTTATASITGNYNINFSRPQGASSYGTVTSTYNCGGCPVHGTSGGTHEMVNDVGQDSVSINVISIKAAVAGKNLVCAGDTVKYTATTYPASGGTVTWSTGQTGRVVYIVVPNNMTVKATFSIGGVAYIDSMGVIATPVSPWTFGVGVPPIAGWKTIQDNMKIFNDAAKKVLSFIPGKITGPTIGIGYQLRDCCKDGLVTVRGESQVSIDVAMGYYATDIPIGWPPFTAQLPPWNFTVCGYQFCAIINYGFFLNAGAEVKGSLGAKKNVCKPEDCFTGSMGLNFPVSLSAKATAQIAYTTWWGNPDTLGVQVTPASVASSFYGSVTYNAANCNAGLAAAIGIGAVTFSASVKILGCTLGYSKNIWDGCVFYQIP